MFARESAADIGVDDPDSVQGHVQPPGKVTPGYVWALLGTLEKDSSRTIDLATMGSISR
jgi:hypothetical protein